MNITFRINMYLPGNNHTTIRVHDVSLHGVFAFRGILKIRIMHGQLPFPVYKNCSTYGNKYQTLIKYRERIGTFRSSYQRNFTLHSPRTLHKIGIGVNNFWEGLLYPIVLQCYLWRSWRSCWVFHAALGWLHLYQQNWWLPYNTWSEFSLRRLTPVKHWTGL